jgi:hypothetical protein
MNPTKKTFIVSSLILSGILWYDYAYIISGIIELIFQKTHHYFVPGIFSTDILLIGFIPFWIYLGYKWKPSKRRILVISITSLLSLLSVMGLPHYYQNISFMISFLFIGAPHLFSEFQLEFYPSNLGGKRTILF